MSTEPRLDPETAGSPADRTPMALAAAVVLALALQGCGETVIGTDGDGSNGDDPPQQAPTSQLTFLDQSPDAPPLLLGDSDGDGFRDTTFVAERGMDAEVEVFYEDPDDPGQPGDRFLEFELEENSLLRYPDDHPTNAGQEFQTGDTIHITFELRGDTLMAEFAPSGLQFNPDEPAELEMRWTNADEDTDDDGTDDLDDREDEIDLWKQESPGEDWFREGDVKDLERDRVRAFVESFTRWALAL